MQQSSFDHVSSMDRDDLSGLSYDLVYMQMELEIEQI